MEEISLNDDNTIARAHTHTAADYMVKVLQRQPKNITWWPRKLELKPVKFMTKSSIRVSTQAEGMFSDYSILLLNLNFNEKHSPTSFFNRWKIQETWTIPQLHEGLRIIQLTYKKRYRNDKSDQMKPKALLDSSEQITSFALHHFPKIDAQVTRKLIFSGEHSKTYSLSNHAPFFTFFLPNLTISNTLFLSTY